MKGILLVLLDYLAASGAKLVPHTCRVIHAYAAVTTFRQIVKTLVMLDQATIEILAGQTCGDYYSICNNACLPLPGV